MPSCALQSGSSKAKSAVAQSGLDRFKPKSTRQKSAGVEALAGDTKIHVAEIPHPAVKHIPNAGESETLHRPHTE